MGNSKQSLLRLWMSKFEEFQQGIQPSVSSQEIYERAKRLLGEK